MHTRRGPWYWVFLRNYIVLLRFDRGPLGRDRLVLESR